MGMGELLYMINPPKYYIVFKEEVIILGAVSNKLGAECGASHWMNVRGKSKQLARAVGGF